MTRPQLNGLSVIFRAHIIGTVFQSGSEIVSANLAMDGLHIPAVTLTDRSHLLGTTLAHVMGYIYLHECFADKSAVMFRRTCPKWTKFALPRTRW